MDIDVYDFNDHMASIEWIQSLPEGLLSQQIDIRYHSVTISKLENGFQIFVGPKDSDLGGDAIVVYLDDNFQLVSYEIERLAPLPE